MFLEHMNLVQTAELDKFPWQTKGYFFLHATFTIFWLNVVFIAVHSVERVAHGPLVGFAMLGLMYVFYVFAGGD